MILKKLFLFWIILISFLIPLAQFLIGNYKTIYMKKSLLFILFIIFSINLQAQKDTTGIASDQGQRNVEAANVSINIYPVPVRQNSFTIRSDKEISSVKITNIIGQDIYRVQYNNPQTITRIPLDNPRRGMYLVTIIFSDGLRVVKKIMIEQSE
jgi:hypothetical protein